MPSESWDAETLVQRYDEVRSHTETPRRATLAGGPDRPVDARRLPDQVAPRPRDLVLRDLRAGRQRARASRRSRTSTGSSSTATTRRSARATPRPDRGADQPSRRPRRRRLPRQRRRPDARPGRPASTRAPSTSWRRTIELGFHHEQQHQELLLMDIKHVLSLQPAAAGVRRRPEPQPPSPTRSAGSTSRAGWSRSVTTDDGFSFDNELPRHQRVAASPTASPTG